MLSTVGLCANATIRLSNVKWEKQNRKKKRNRNFPRNQLMKIECTRLLTTVFWMCTYIAPTQWRWCSCWHAPFALYTQRIVVFLNLTIRCCGLIRYFIVAVTIKNDALCRYEFRRIHFHREWEITTSLSFCASFVHLSKIECACEMMKCV